MKHLLAMMMIALLGACSSLGSEDPSMVDYSVEQATERLKEDLKKALSNVEFVEDPIPYDSGPLPCDDPPNDDPDRAMATYAYEGIVQGEQSASYVTAVKEALEQDGWSVRSNEGAPEDDVMFFAERDQYTVTVSGSRTVANLAISGSTPCAKRGEGSS